MNKIIENLLALQDVDLKIRSLNIRLSSIPLERAKLVKEFHAVCDEVDNAKEKVLKIEQEQKKQNALTQSLQESHQSLLIRSGTIKRNTEYQNMMAEINRIKQKISDSETKELELMDAHDSAGKELVQYEKHYRAVGRLAKAEVLNLDKMKIEIEDEIKRLKTIAAQRKNFIPVYILSDYNRLLASNRNFPLGKIEKNSCPNCALGILPQTQINAKKGNLVKCDNCGCFLYDPEPQE